MTPLALELLRAEIHRRGSIQGAANSIGVSRTALSLILGGKYPADTSRIEAKVLAIAGRVECPHLGDLVRGDHCIATALGPCPSHTPQAAAAWRACLSCQHRPPEPPPAKERRRA